MKKINHLIEYHLCIPDRPHIDTLQNTFRNRGDYRIPFVQHLMEYPIEYLKECLVEYHPEYPVVEYLTEDRLCNIPHRISSRIPFRIPFRIPYAISDSIPYI